MNHPGWAGRYSRGGSELFARRFVAQPRKGGARRRFASLELGSRSSSAAARSAVRASRSSRRLEPASAPGSEPVAARHPGRTRERVFVQGSGRSPVRWPRATAANALAVPWRPEPRRERDPHAGRTPGNATWDLTLSKSVSIMAPQVWEWSPRSRIAPHAQNRMGSRSAGLHCGERFCSAQVFLLSRGACCRGIRSVRRGCGVGC